MKSIFVGGIPAALGAALLFGAGTPLAKVLLGSVSPWMLAGILYLGSGVGLAVMRSVSRAPRAAMKREDIPWLAGAILSGGVAGPVLLMWGLARMPAATASLLLNSEGVFTALLAWFVFHENFDRRIALGMALIVAGAMVLSWPGRIELAAIAPSIAVVAACFAWAIDNNLTRRVSLADATLVAMLKGLAAGAVNIALAWAAGGTWPPVPQAAAGAALGFFSYGLSLVLFVRALRDLGTARTGAYFSTAPFAGAALSILLLHEQPTWALGLSTLLMGLGVWLHLTEHHVHRHDHAPLDHEHEHVHDAHHWHHAEGDPASALRHSHPHHHDAMTHAHEHFPDSHHRHQHRG